MYRIARKHASIIATFFLHLMTKCVELQGISFKPVKTVCVMNSACVQRNRPKRTEGRAVGPAALIG
jgi:hypothetical protein